MSIFLKEARCSSSSPCVKLGMGVKSLCAEEMRICIWKDGWEWTEKVWKEIPYLLSASTASQCHLPPSSGSFNYSRVQIKTLQQGKWKNFLHEPTPLLSSILLSPASHIFNPVSLPFSSPWHLFHVHSFKKVGHLIQSLVTFRKHKWEPAGTSGKNLIFPSPTISTFLSWKPP